MIDPIGSMAAIVAERSAVASTDALGVVASPTATGGRVLVLIDGQNEPVECETVTTVNAGDRVALSIRGGTATVTGNLTNRATDAKTFADAMREIGASANCIEQTDEGLMIGNKDASGNWYGALALITSTGFNIVRASGEVLSSYTGSQIKLGGCVIRSGDEAVGDGLNIYSEDGIIRVSAKPYAEGSAGTASKTRPPLVEVDGSSVTLKVEYFPEGVEPGSGSKKSNRVVVDDTGIHLYGDLYHNDVKM